MKKSIIITGTVILVVVLTLWLLYSRHARIFSTDNGKSHIISEAQDIPLQEAKMFLKGFPAQSANEDPRQYFSQKLNNAYTVRFFKFLQTSIAFTTLEEHLKAVKAYLLTILPKDQAEEMFALYKKFIDYEIQLNEKAQYWGTPKTPDDFLRYLQSIQDFRRDFFGKETADAMWGAEIKVHEYNIRKNSILGDQNLYGADKEKRISNLKEEMWGKEAALIDEPAQNDVERYERYQEKQMLYQRDMQEMTESGKQSKIREFRDKYFTSDQVAKLEQVDQEMAEERQKEADYQAREKVILNNPDISDEKKAEAIRELQNSLFGEEADALRRRINIRKQSQKQD